MKIGGNHVFLRVDQATIIPKSSKIKSNVWQIEALLSLKDAWLPQTFLLDIKSAC